MTDLDITPEPSPEERAAIEAALRPLLREEREAEAASEWWASGFEEEDSGD
jgi:hypothetical protein